MGTLPRTTRFSVLDRSRTRRDETAADALRTTVRFAREAEHLGFHRFWVAEHHGVPGVAGSAPTVLAAAVASATERIRVGTGGVMLPNHRPLVVAEQFGVLEALFPGRVDMGLGRSVGFTDGVRRALGRDKDAADGFPDDLAELLGYFTGDQTAHPGVHARPAEGLRPAPFVLATGEGAEYAARAGLPLVIALFGAEERTVRAIDAYRTRFRPSDWAHEPYVVIAGSVAVADTPEDAEDLLVPEAWSAAYARTHGVFPPLMPADEIRALAMTAKERTYLADGLRGHIRGTEDDVEAELGRLVGRTGADEFLVTTSTFDVARRSDTYARIARLAGLTATVG
ncbi:LLM class flavin-dependent oxidoreductase [Yinghuangia sp. ASG 101]|uniref:LLM class flavin-dependent oxidoreductase n=1 Tax=Yinghuangia sp. ASG 101 TaxID=2896848 RepID=UPI001E597980|nr:LLM class flavin-dependent oxidoreductase [Yinghuangia sp. ASG 101]UGQ12191.1 LLM class flavin-dependent oxidoreductase [Yinghuangia sp. ASG 101]